MKRMLIAALAALAIAASASAQSAAPAPAQGQTQAQTVTVSGKLELINGVIGVKSGGTTYYVPRLRQLVGFVKDLQEGASVKLEGYAYPIPNNAGASLLMATKLTIGGKDYDLGQNGFGPFDGKGMGGYGRGGMRGGRMGGGMWGGQRW